MKTAGEILSEKRKELGFSLDQIEKETKIRKKFIEAIERNNYSLFQDSITVRGFIRNYSISLGLSPENVLAVFRRDFEENKKGQIIPRGFIKEIEEKSFHWTPKITFYLSIVLIFSFFSYFFLRQYWRFSSAPKLEISSPVEDQIYFDKVRISGKTDKDATLSVNDYLISVSGDGNFNEEIVFPKGDNLLVIEVANRQGKKRVVNVKVKVE